MHHRWCGNGAHLGTCHCATLTPHTRGGPIPAFHLKSIQEILDGNLLVSFRHLWGVLSIHKKDGKVNWELGDEHSNFRIGPGAHVEWQHDARLHSHCPLTVFDNGAGLTRNENSHTRSRWRCADTPPIERLDVAANLPASHG